MKHSYTDPRSGITVRGPAEFMDALADAVEEGRRKERAWVAALIAEGVKAAHPDDGWHDRVGHSVSLCYPYFQDDIGVGDRIALGTPDAYRIITVARITEWRRGYERYHYEPGEQSG